MFPAAILDNLPRISSSATTQSFNPGSLSHILEELAILSGIVLRRHKGVTSTSASVKSGLPQNPICKEEPEGGS